MWVDDGGGKAFHCSFIWNQRGEDDKQTPVGVNLIQSHTEDWWRLEENMKRPGEIIHDKVWWEQIWKVFWSGLLT